MPLVHHTVGIIIKDLLLKGVEFQPSMTCGESRYEDVSLGPFDCILFDTGLDGLQDVVGTQSDMRVNKWAGSWTVTMVGFLTRSPNLPQKPRKKKEKE